MKLDFGKRYLTQLESINIYQEEHDGVLEYFLETSHIIANESGKYRITVPKILLPVELLDFLIICINDRDLYINFGLGNMKLLEKDGYFVKNEVIEEKVHEMTLEEIEERIGYKIKIVDKKKGDINNA